MRQSGFARRMRWAVRTPRRSAVCIGTRDGDQLRAADLGVVPWFEGEVERVGREAGAFEEGFRPGDAEGLVAELVAGQQ